MNTHDIADDMAALCRQGRFDEAGEKYWDDAVASFEAMPGEMAEVRGKEAVRAKGDWWGNAHDVHRVEVDGPYVNGDQFALRFRMDFTQKASGERLTMDELGLYTVRNGKIVEERFLYGR